MPNWLDGERRDRILCELVNPSGYGHVGWLDGVTNVRVTEGYESDTRINATVATIAPETYVDLAMVRLIHVATFAGGEEWREVIGTFFAMRGADVSQHGGTETTFQLRSALYGMSEDLAPLDLTVAKGSTASAAFAKMCQACKRPRLWVDGANDARFSANRTFAAGESYLSWLHQLANATGNRLDVDPQGRVTMSRYVRPRERAAGMRLAWNSPLVLSSGIRRTPNAAEVPGRAVVTWEHEKKVRVRNGTYTYGANKGRPKYTEKTVRSTVTAYADAAPGSPNDIDRRGYRITSWHSEDDLGESQAVAQQRAAQYLDEEDEPRITWEVPARWFDVHEGDVIAWLPPGESSWRKCLVHNLDRNLSDFVQTITLREV